MERLDGWENANCYGDFKTLKAGAYKCIIKNVEELRSSNNKKFVKICLDIADGEFKDYFTDKYKNDTRTDKKWSGIWNLFEEGFEQGSINSKFKGFITSIERSNYGYIWDWHEQTLTNKVVGIVFRDEEFRADDGKTKISAKPFYAIPIEDLDKVKIPEPKLLETNEDISNVTSNYNYDNSDAFIGDDLPF